VSDALVAPLVSAVLRSRAVRSLITRLVAYLIAAALLAIAFGFLVATLYLVLTETVEPPLAALLTSLCLGVVACLILLAMRLRKPRRKAAATTSPEALLLSMTEQVRRDPLTSLVIAAVLGALAEVGRSPSSSPPPT
jgi:divalent metal cation (Fe/Co/Zn/Cd) transporter